MPQVPIYLDYNATTPVDPRVLEEMLPYFNQQFGNAASNTHKFGWAAAEAVDIAREQIASSIGADKTEIIFTSGSTEACNLAIKGVFESYRAKGSHIITSVIEHKAVLDTCKHLEKLGASVTYLEVDDKGDIDPLKLQQSIRPDTILVAFMYANNEIGNINPIKEISAIAKEHGAIFFSDATQAVGKVPVNVDADGIDLMAINAHKIYGPKGVGALYVRRKNPRVKLIAQMDGGGHERGLRSGTLNVPGIVGFGKAVEICNQELADESIRIAALRDKLESGLLKLEHTKVNGNIHSRLPNVSNMSFNNWMATALLSGLDGQIAISSGSACTSASMEPSYVLKALGLSDEVASNATRFSLGRFTSEDDIDFVLKTVNAKKAESLSR